MGADEWARLAEAQGGMIARRQLLALGVDADRVRDQIRARRWALATPRVVCTFTGPLPWRSAVWRAVLHVGGDGLVGALSALEWHGLSGWHRDEITVLIDDELSPEPVPGVRYFRTRRPLPVLRDDRLPLPIARVEPAALLVAGYDRSGRTAQGVLAAVVQQRLSRPADLLAELERMRPVRRSRLLKGALLEIEQGAQSVAELDVGRLCRRRGLPPPKRQQARRDAGGRARFTDCEWLLPDGTVLILEVDGSFHMDVANWEDDLARQRGLTSTGRLVVRCTARELRDAPDRVFRDLLRLGLSRLCA